jgi:hypothetical protein
MKVGYGPFMSIDTKGGEPTFAAGAMLDGSLRLSGHYKRYQESISA